MGPDEREGRRSEYEVQFLLQAQDKLINSITKYCLLDDGPASLQEGEGHVVARPGSTVLAVIGFLKQVEPGLHRCGAVVQHHSVHKDSGSALNTLGAVGLPHSTRVHVCVIRIRRGVDCLYVSHWKVKLGSDFRRPLGFEVNLGNVHLIQHVQNLVRLVNPVPVLFQVAQVLLSAKSLEVGDNLMHLERMNMIRQGEGSKSPVDLILDGAAKPWGSEHLVPNVVIGEAIGAEEVNGNFNSNASLPAANNPTRIGSVNGSSSRNNGSK